MAVFKYTTPAEFPRDYHKFASELANEICIIDATVHSMDEMVQGLPLDPNDNSSERAGTTLIWQLQGLQDRLEALLHVLDLSTHVYSGTGAAPATPEVAPAI